MIDWEQRMINSLRKFGEMGVTAYIKEYNEVTDEWNLVPLTMDKIYFIQNQGDSG